MVPKASIHRSLQGRPDFRNLIILSDPTDVDAIAGARVVKFLLKDCGQGVVFLDADIKDDGFLSSLRNLNVNAGIWLVSSNTLKSMQQLARLSVAHQHLDPKLVLPVIQGDSFPLPGARIFDELATGGGSGHLEQLAECMGGNNITCTDVAESVRVTFSTIAVYVNVSGAPLYQLKVQLNAVDARIDKILITKPHPSVSKEASKNATQYLQQDNRQMPTISTRDSEQPTAELTQDSSADQAIQPSQHCDVSGRELQLHNEETMSIANADLVWVDI
jgi:hypothetical protein